MGGNDDRKSSKRARTRSMSKSSSDDELFEMDPDITFTWKDPNIASFLAKRGNVQNVVCPFPIPQNCTVDEFKATVIRHIALRSGGNEHMEVAVLGTFEQFIRALRALDRLNVHEWFRAVNDSGAQNDNSFPLAHLGTKNTRNRSLPIGERDILPNTVPFY